MSKALLLSLLVSVVCQDVPIATNVEKYLNDNGDRIASARKSATLPRGTIVMLASKQVDKWFNLLGEGIGEYAGWYICDGRNGSPDLRGRFVVGRDALNQNSDYASIGDTGGASHVALTADTIPAHTHHFEGKTAASGNHSHSYDDIWYPDRSHLDHNRAWNQCSGERCGSVPMHSHLLATALGKSYFTTASQLRRETFTAKEHSHSFKGTTGAFGAGKPHENRPPYYVVIFVVYIGA